MSELFINQERKQYLLSISEPPKDINSFTTFINTIYQKKHIQNVRCLLNIKKIPAWNHYYLLFFEEILPWLIKRVQSFLKKNKYTTISRISANSDITLELDKDDVLDLMVAMTFGLYSDPKQSQNIDFEYFFFEYCGTSTQKLLCILEYFHENINRPHYGKFILHRCYLSNPFTENDLKYCSQEFSPFQIFSTGKIGDQPNEIKVDFADQYIGGYVLTHGDLQEEIMFVESPECLLSVLFCEKMENREAIIIEGADLYSDIIGYGTQFQFNGPIGKNKRLNDVIISIDAREYYNVTNQFDSKELLREINKAYIGFISTSSFPYPIGTGKWGCGAFGGITSLKVIIQWIAATMAKKQINFYTFGNQKEGKELSDFINYVQSNHITVADISTKLFELHTIKDKNKLINNVYQYVLSN
ncbi:hypothetical protein WA158_000483 [Blastocystis sp. Blastoise]